MVLQVCIPGLHISLGIFDRLYNLLADACHELDVLVAEQNAGEGRAGMSFSQYQEAFRKRTELQKKIDYCQAVISNQMLPYLTLNMPDTSTNHPVVVRCRESVEEYHQQMVQHIYTCTCIIYLHAQNCMLITYVYMYTQKKVDKLTKIIDKKFLIRNGPFYSALEGSIAELGVHVQRQAYQGGAFVGNHVHR